MRTRTRLWAPPRGLCLRPSELLNRKSKVARAAGGQPSPFHGCLKPSLVPLIRPCGRGCHPKMRCYFFAWRYGATGPEVMRKMSRWIGWDLTANGYCLRCARGNEAYEPRWLGAGPGSLRDSGARSRSGPGETGHVLLLQGTHGLPLCLALVRVSKEM